MKVFLLCLFLSVVHSRRTKDDSDIPEPRYPLAEAVNSFGAELLVEFRKENPTSSVVFSPYSITAAFYLLYQGAEGKTAKELESLFDFKDPEVQDGLTARFPRNSSVALANRVYIDKTVIVKKSYIKGVGRRKVKRVNFVKKSDRVRKQINRWVKRRTSGFIKNLLSSGSIDASTVTVIVNALYFQGTWSRPFPIKATSDGIFKGINGNESVPFMQLSDVTLGYKRIKQLDGSMVILPYKRDDFSMYVFIPNKKNGWKKAEKAFPKYAGHIFDSGFSSQSISVLRMPKWEMETELSGLVDILMELGIPQTLSSKSNFSGISETAPITVSDVIHKAKITVDEEGTEAAAATVIVTARSAPLFPPIKLVVDRPFLFFIVKDTDRSVLFQGTVTTIKRT